MVEENDVIHSEFITPWAELSGITPHFDLFHSEFIEAWEIFDSRFSRWLINKPVVSGVIRDKDNILCQRTIRVYNRSTGALIKSVTSDSLTGEYTLKLNNEESLQLIALDNSVGAMYGDKISRIEF
jgi:hypothetical protein